MRQNFFLQFYKIIFKNKKFYQCMFSYRLSSTLFIINMIKSYEILWFYIFLQLEMENDDVIEVYQEQTGGHYWRNLLSFNLF